MPNQPSNLAPLEHNTLAEQVYLRLRDSLRQGQWEAGQLLTLRGLAEDFGISPMPVREALARLVSEGILESLPNRKVRVPLLSISQYTALTEARIACEGHATWLAAHRITPEELVAVSAANKELRAAIRNRDHAAVMVANQAVHFGIYRAARSDVLMQMIEGLWQQGGPYLAKIERQMTETIAMHDHDFGADQHDDICAALGNRDAARAQAMLIADIEHFVVIYRSLLGASATAAGPDPERPRVRGLKMVRSAQF